MPCCRPRVNYSKSYSKMSPLCVKVASTPSLSVLPQAAGGWRPCLVNFSGAWVPLMQAHLRTNLLLFNQIRSCALTKLMFTHLGWTCEVQHHRGIMHYYLSVGLSLHGLGNCRQVKKKMSFTSQVGDWNCWIPMMRKLITHLPFSK